MKKNQGNSNQASLKRNRSKVPLTLAISFNGFQEFGPPKLNLNYKITFQLKAARAKSKVLGSAEGTELAICEPRDLEKFI